MAPIDIVSVLFILALGSRLCFSKECTDDNIDKCFIYGEIDCINRHKQIECMEKIDTSTCSDKVLEGYNKVLSQARLVVDDCPGLPEGTCFYNFMSNCRDGVPYWLVFPGYPKPPEDEIKKMCQEFKGKEDKTRTCFTALKPKCKADYILQDIDKQLKYVDDIQKKCASYE